MSPRDVFLILGWLLFAAALLVLLRSIRRQYGGADALKRQAGYTLAEKTSEGVLALDERGRVIYHNLAAQTIFGGATLLDRPLVDLLAVWWQPALQLMEEGQTDFECKLREGSYRLRSLPLHPRGRLVILSDLSKQRDLERRLEASETTDSLTGLANRARLFEMASREVYRAYRYHRALSVVLVQVDEFSALNNRYGYAVGEQIISTLAQRCRENIRLADSLARWGEDTFALLLPETDLEQGRKAAERIRRILSGLPIQTQRGEVNVALSTGVAALCEAAPVAAGPLLDQAAAALQEGRAEPEPPGGAAVVDFQVQRKE